MTGAGIFNGVISVLQNSTYLSYIDDNNIFKGARDGVTIFPCIIVERAGDRLLQESFSYEERVKGLNIIVFIQVYDKDKQIVGDANTKGVEDIENDIRKAISADITLGLSDVFDTRILNTPPDDLEQYPIRGFVINIEVHYKQNRLTRA